MSMRFDLIDLRLMARMAEAHSATGVAEATHLSVPAASTQIKGLEKAACTKRRSAQAGR